MYYSFKLLRSFVVSFFRWFGWSLGLFLGSLARSFFHSFVVYLLVCWFVDTLFVRWMVFSPVRSFVRSLARSFVRASVRPFVRSLRRSFVRSFVHSFGSFVRSFVRASIVGSFVRAVVRSFARSFVLSFVRSLVRSFFGSLVRPLALSFVYFSPLVPSFVPFYALLFCLDLFFFILSSLVPLFSFPPSRSRAFTLKSPTSSYPQISFHFFQSSAFFVDFLSQYRTSLTVTNVLQLFISRLVQAV